MKWIPKILSLICLWGAVAGVIVFIEPELLKDVIIPGSYLPFMGLVMLATWYTLALIVKSMLKSLLLTVTIMASLVLTMSRLMHPGLVVVLLLTLVIESWYIYKSK